MKTKNMTTSDLKKSSGRSRWRLGFLLIPLTLASLALSPQMRAVRQEGYDTSNANRFLGNNTLLNNTSGSEDTATGSGAQSSHRLFFAGRRPFGLAIGDFNRDGIIDIAVANYASFGVSVLLGKGGGEFEAPLQFTAGPQARGIVAADFNGDGILDLAVANQHCCDLGDGTVSILIGNGDGTFKDHVDYATGGGPTWVATGDFNSDGKLDLVVSGVGDNVGVLLGNGDGTFQPVVRYRTGINPAYVVTADFNGDNNLDLAVVNNIGSVSILLGNGDGSFGRHQDLTVGSFPIGAAAADFNRDGKVDLAVVNTGSNNVSVLLGNGDGTFATPVQYETGVGPWAVIAADVNPGGCPDLVVTNASTSGGLPGDGSTVSVLLGNCDGTFRNHRVFSTGVGAAFLAVDHFSGGRKPDLAVTNFNQHSVSILLGNFSDEDRP
jgi:FG-GAP-like repeat